MHGGDLCVVLRMSSISNTAVTFLQVVFGVIDMARTTGGGTKTNTQPRCWRHLPLGYSTTGAGCVLFVRVES